MSVFRFKDGISQIERCHHEKRLKKVCGNFSSPISRKIPFSSKLDVKGKFTSASISFSAKQYVFSLTYLFKA